MLLIILTMSESPLGELSWNCEGEGDFAVLDGGAERFTEVVFEVVEEGEHFLELERLMPLSLTSLSLLFEKNNESSSTSSTSSSSSVSSEVAEAEADAVLLARLDRLLLLIVGRGLLAALPPP
jgi:hypothetical protein